MADNISVADLQPLLVRHEGNRLFKRAWEQMITPTALLSVLGRYVHFNATFGGCVANLAGEVGVRQDLFRDAEEPITALADRSMEIGSDIFAAAVDEFDDRATPHRDTHRSLASATLIGAGRFFHQDDAALDTLFQPDAATRQAVLRVHDGYGVNRSLDEAALFQAIGFHAGSEIIADEEFRILDGCLRAQFPDLVAALETTKVHINDEHHAAYHWIHIHTSVEADHFAFALRGANRALRFYTGASEDGQAKQWILEGFAQFADVQTAFMAALAYA